MKHLVIVESPAKAKTIAKFLGKDYTLKSSFWHIRDLPKKWLGVDVENNFTPEYEVMSDKKKVVTELKKLVKTHEEVILATDEDREWEAIAWHLCHALKLNVEKTKRIAFHEITKEALKKAVKNPGFLNLDLVNAQQARRVLDRLVWFQVSPLLWKKIRKGLSAGRVQSVAVKLLVEREREIKTFIAKEQWKVFTSFRENGVVFQAEFLKFKGKKKVLKSEDEIKKFFSILGIQIKDLEVKKDKKDNLTIHLDFQKNFELVKKEIKDSKRKAPPPFTTSTLQQEASRKMGLWVKQTMMVAQQLYESGFITYMRTDSVNLSSQAVNMCREHIEKHYGLDYVPKTPKKYKTKSASAQEAHESIRPTYIDKTPESVSFDTPEKLKLYTLIWKRTVASQMSDAKVEVTTFVFDPKLDDPQEWVSKGEVIQFSGFMKLYIEDTDEEKEEREEKQNIGNKKHTNSKSEEIVLPNLTQGNNYTSHHLNARQGFTRPPARYTEASLVKKLEAEGIGRPSTYAPTISTIIDRGYVEKENKKLYPTDIAETVIDFLQDNFTDLMDYQFTSQMEVKIDTVAHGKLAWEQMMHTFYQDFSKKVKSVDENAGMVQEKVGKKCPECGNELIYKFSKMGKFIGCSHYPECKYLEKIPDPEREKKLDILRKKYEGNPCEAGGTIVVKVGRYGPFLASSLYPEVKWIGKIPTPLIEALQNKLWEKKCDKCEGGKLIAKSSRKGPFLACTNYPECKNSKNIDKSLIADVKKELEKKLEEEENKNSEEEEKG